MKRNEEKKRVQEERNMERGERE
jgi:hypothetical protein